MTHTSNIDILRAEAQRQIQLLKQLLQEMQTQGLIAEPAEKQQDRATFDTESLPQTLEMLEGEHHKLQNLEMVLAVVGTMKAGKSTSINAIVGAEVLPNRNRPMTALPTLIRHKPGVLQPRLVLQAVAPLNQLLKQLNKVLPPLEEQALEELKQNEPDMAELREQIQQKQPFQAEYEGEEAIFQFLKRLNDLVRLCFEQDDPQAAFPFEQYTSVHTLPVIEVEFSHLKDLSAAQGQLTLLDTPGPNEAGQQHLRHMLKDQLRKASAVLAVLDYTQLKSDADADIRQELEHIAETAGERMYALVNKFDQKDRNSDDAATVKKYVAHTLMQGTVHEDHVFPVSSKQGYLASRARNELARHGRLDGSQAWVQDFGDEVFGKRWARFIDDPQETQQGANELWEVSGFSAPLEKIIVQAHQNAAFHALHSAVKKLQSTSENTSHFLKACVGAQRKGVKELEQSIVALQQDIENISYITREVQQALDDEFSSMNKGVDKAIADVIRNADQAIEGYFRDGKRIEKENLIIYRKNERKSPKKILSKEIDKLKNHLLDSPQKNKKKPEERDFDPESPIIKFENMSEAKDFQNKIQKSIQALMDASEQSINEKIQDGAEELISLIKNKQDNAMKQIEKSANKNLEDFEIEISQQKFRPEILKTSASSLLKNCIQEKSRIVTKHRRQTGVWGTVCSWFGTSDWGWEEYKVKEQYQEIDLEKIESSIQKGIEILESSAKETLQQEIRPQLQSVIDDFFNAFQRKIEHVRGDLVQNLQWMETHSKVQQEAMLQSAQNMQKQAQGICKDCDSLHAATQALHEARHAQASPALMQP
ncbi:dynamin family protein [Vandammella animalimorsus]|nr:dynamin family protein [Vandammella animalimorsus]